MSPDRHPRRTPRSRRLFVWPLATLGAMALAAGCGKDVGPQPLGTCTNTSTNQIVGTDVTSAECTRICPTCTWTANGS